MSQHISDEKRTALNLVAEVARRLGNGGLRAADVQALLEGVPQGTSSLDGKLVDYGRGVKAPAGQTMVIYGTYYRRHAKGGGWVPVDQDEHDPDKPYVSDQAFVGPRVIIEGNTKIYGGWFYGGVFLGGQFYGGWFYGGLFRDGVFEDGVFEGGWFYGGMFHGGQFYGGMFHGGQFYGGMFKGGAFEGGSYADPSKTCYSTADADEQ